MTRLDEIREATKGHTPGPWIVDHDDDTVYQIGPISTMEYAGCSWIESKEDVDLNLIVAAPELLEIATQLEQRVKELEELQQLVSNVDEVMGVSDGQ